MDAFAIFGIQTFFSFVVFGLLDQRPRVITLLALRTRFGFAIALVWLTNIVGFADLVNALVGGVRYDIARLGMGWFWFVVTILVPILWIAHVLAFALLFRRRA